MNDADMIKHLWTHKTQDHPHLPDEAMLFERGEGIYVWNKEGRRFIKPLRYDAPRAEAFANALLLDVGQRALPLHLVSPYMDERSRTAKRRAIELAQHDAWVWETDRPLPTLPKPARPAG